MSESSRETDDHGQSRETDERGQLRETDDQLREADTQSGEADYRGVLVYDGECPFCSAASSALRRVEGVGAIAWEDDPAQSFLRAQFGETPFALVFADSHEEQVYVGREAARELCERAGMPVLVQDVVGDNYESIADAIRTVTGVDGDPDPYHGVYPMAEEAREVFGELAANAWHTAKVSR